MSNWGSRIAVFALGILTVATPAHSQGITDMKKGEGGSVVQGSAGPSGSQGSSDLARCDKPMGALAVVEPQSYVSQALARYQLGSPVSLIRLMVQQSNCFLVVERGMGMRNMMQERSLADSGQLREGSNMGGGQMVSADFVLTPAVVFSENNAGGVGGGLGAVGPLFGRGGRFVGAIGGGIAGGLKFKEAQTSMLVSDARSGIQVAAAEGSASKSDFNIGGFLGGFGGGVGAGAALGGYSNTNEGKVIAASFADNYNKVVQVVRGNPSLQRNVGTLAEEAAAGGMKKAGAVFNEGDVLRPKIATVRLLAKPSEAAQVVSTLTKADEMIFLGKEEDGYVQVETGKGSGWVKKLLIAR
jgi:curli production assembly/transport component CsgG